MLTLSLFIANIYIINLNLHLDKQILNMFYTHIKTNKQNCKFLEFILEKCYSEIVHQSLNEITLECHYNKRKNVVC